MVRDIPGQGEDQAALEWGVDWDLDEGEELPVDHEELSDAQFAVFQFMQHLKGTFEEAGAKVIRGDAPTGIILPKEP